MAADAPACARSLSQAYSEFSSQSSPSYRSARYFRLRKTLPRKSRRRPENARARGFSRRGETNVWAIFQYIRRPEDMTYTNKHIYTPIQKWIHRSALKARSENGGLKGHEISSEIADPRTQVYLRIRGMKQPPRARSCPGLEQRQTRAGLHWWTLNPRGLTSLPRLQTRELCSKNEKYFDCYCVNEDFTREHVTLSADRDRGYTGDNVFPFAGRRQVSQKRIVDTDRGDTRRTSGERGKKKKRKVEGRFDEKYEPAFSAFLPLY